MGNEIAFAEGEQVLNARVYMGSREDGRAVVKVQDLFAPEKGIYPLDPAPSQKLRNHSPDGFEWGYGGSGPSQLALAILLDLGFTNEAALENYHPLKWELIATLGHHSGGVFALTTGDIKTALKNVEERKKNPRLKGTCIRCGGAWFETEICDGCQRIEGDAH